MKVNLDLMAARRLPGAARDMVQAVRAAHESAEIVFWCIVLAVLPFILAFLILKLGG